MNETSRPRLLVIGGGVAGSSFATMVDHDRWDVTLVEKQTFPRVKICGGCIGPPGMRLLDRVGVLDQCIAASMSTQRWIGYTESGTIPIATPRGMAICRSRLDPILIDAAQRKGTKVRFGTEAKIVVPGGRSTGGHDGGGHGGGGHDAATIQHPRQCNGTDRRRDDRALVRLNSREERFDLVVAANGLVGLNLTRFLPWRSAPHGPHGVGFHFRGQIEPHAIHMVVGREGYVGLVQLPDDRVDVAAAIDADAKSPVQSVVKMIADSTFPFRIDATDAESFQTTPPLRRQRIAANGRVLAIGDALRYVEPFTGEGMTWAMQTADAAASLIDSCEVTDVAKCYRQTAAKIASKHRRRCERLTSAIRYRSVRSVAAWGLQRFPSLASPIVRHLASD